MENIDLRTGRTDPTQRSVGELIGEVTNDLSRLFRQEIELAKVEIKQEATKAGKSAALLGGAGYAAHMVGLLVSLAAVLALGHVMPDGWAALLVAAAWAAGAAALYSAGRRGLRSVNPVPEQTVETIKEDAQWAKTLTR